MDKKVVAIIVTIVAILLCACPGLVGIFMGVLSALASFIPGAEIDVFGSSDPSAALNMGLGTMCGGFVLLIIAAVAIFMVWRRNKNNVEPI
jgi:uncharacterized membrane protein